MKFKCTTLDAYNLLHEGSLVMAEMERNGICVDMDYVKKTKVEIQNRIDKLTDEIKQDEIYKVWRKEYGSKTKLSSREQLGQIMYKKMGYKSKENTEGGRYKADEKAMEDIGIPFVKKYLQCEKLKKAKNTYLSNIERETVDGIIHPNFNLNTVVTFRSSSDHPNFQNIPMREPDVKKLVRQCFIPRKGNHIVDMDFKGSEVSGACWYHKDPVMIDYINDPTKDMHGDMALQIFMISKKQLTKELRHVIKNKFVFPQFYGDWWLSCARNIWRDVGLLNLKTANDIPIKAWLKKKGITELGTGDSKIIKPKSFEAHLKAVEEDFWYDRFSVYQDWKDRWWADYQDRGYFKMLTGFIISGHLNRKQCVNYPVQGSSFHGLLWSVIRISQLLKKYKMKTKLIGQIHDDVVSDVPDNELKNYLEIATDVITVQLEKHWPFIITPMKVEVEVTPIDKSWYYKEAYKI